MSISKSNFMVILIGAVAFPLLVLIMIANHHLQNDLDELLGSLNNLEEMTLQLEINLDELEGSLNELDETLLLIEVIDDP